MEGAAEEEEEEEEENKFQVHFLCVCLVLKRLSRTHTRFHDEPLNSSLFLIATERERFIYI